MRVLIVGCSRLGRRLAKILAHSGHQVTVIDSKAEALERLGPDFPGEVVKGVGIDLGVLEEANISQADVVIATTDKDSTNLVVAEIAHEKYKIPRVVARLYDPEAAEAYRKKGLAIFCPTTLGVEYILSLIGDESQGGKA